MGLRIRKTLTIIPGVRLNLSKSGGSLSLGGKGMTVNLNKNGAKETVGLPGSGLSYSHDEKRKNGGMSWLRTLLLAAGALVVFYLRR